MWVENNVFLLALDLPFCIFALEMLMTGTRKIFINLMLLIILSGIASFRGSAENIISILPERHFLPDSVLYKIYDNASFYSHQVNGFKSVLYLKGRFTINKRNKILKYVPSMFSMEDSINTYLHESISELQYTAPSIYDRKVKAISTTFKSHKGKIFDIMDYMKFNIYSSSLMGGSILSPLHEHSKIHYNYSVDTIASINGSRFYKVLVKPKFRSTKLIDGYLWLSVDDWSVTEFEFSGVYGLLTFKVKMNMGNTPDTKFLPCYLDFDADFKFLGNNMHMSYAGWIDYTEVKLVKDGEIINVKDKKEKYNLSNSYTLTCDTSKLITDLDSFSKLRPFPLTEYEDSLYNDRLVRIERNKIYEKQDSLYRLKEKKSLVFWGQLGDALISSYDIDLPKMGSVKCSPLINPLLISYSHRKGVSYRQEFKYNRLFYDGKLLRITPQIGYNFTKKEFYAQADIKYVYNPKKNAEFEINVGNGKRIYSSVVLDQLKDMPDSTLSFEGLSLDYFKDINLNVSHKFEIINGLSLWTGISMHWRYTKSNPEIESRVRSHYNSFAPRIKLEWTPGMYYYMNGNRKVNVGSYYPTFRTDYERGLSVFKNSSEYERLEVAAIQKIRIRNLQSISYNAGCGFFFNRKDVYFADFVNFTNSNLPEGWDDIGGTFQMLDSRWYNASSHYFKCNVTYESPFILLYPVSKILSFIEKERVYGGILFMPYLNPYFELGYGIGTHIFDAGIFIGNERGKFTSLGFKFTFELFNR